MPAKVCIVSALAVLFLALATGNPFLPRPKGADAAPVPIVQMVSLRTGAAAAVARDLPACPVPALQPLVVEVRFDADGTPRWLLRDGRVVDADGLASDGLASDGLASDGLASDGVAIDGRTIRAAPAAGH